MPWDTWETINYPYFSVEYMIMIVLCFCVLAVVSVISFRKKQYFDTVLVVMSVILGVLTAMLIGYAVISGDNNLEWYLPLHLCNLFTIVVPLAGVFKGKFRAFFMDFMCVCGILGCMAAVLFPMTTVINRPPLHFISVTVWLYHIAIGSLGVYMISSGAYRRFSAVNIVSVATVLAVAAYFVNGALGTNFMFINPDKAFFPLNIFYLLFGRGAMLVVYAAIYGALFSVQLAFFVYGRLKTKSIMQILNQYGAVRVIAHLRLKASDSELIAFLARTKGARKINAKYLQPVVKFLRTSARSGFIGDILNTPIERLATAEIIKIAKSAAGQISKQLSISEIKRVERYYRSTDSDTPVNVLSVSKNI
jgi:uncharacterized membrane protein YwaF